MPSARRLYAGRAKSRPSVADADTPNDLVRPGQVMQITRMLADPRDASARVANSRFARPFGQRLLQPGDPAKGNVLMQPV